MKKLSEIKLDAFGMYKKAIETLLVEELKCVEDDRVKEPKFGELWKNEGSTEFVFILGCKLNTSGNLKVVEYHNIYFKNQDRKYYLNNSWGLPYFLKNYKRVTENIEY